MSLRERVRAAGNGVGSVAAAAELDELRRRLQELLPSHAIAQMREENPKRAENEVRAACERVFEIDPWFVEDASARQGLVDALVDGLFGLGPLEWMLADPAITEIMVNASNSLYIERAGVLEPQGNPFRDDEAVRLLIDRIIGPLGRRIDESSPAVNARLEAGHRVHAIIPPLALDGPVLTIRKFREQVLTLDEMTASGSLEERAKRFLVRCVRERKNIAVSGGTGSGKTTMLNALSCEIDHGERILTIEDSAELRFHEHPHVVRLEARPPSVEGTGEVTIRDLVIEALRMRPDRIIVGECRGAEASDMLAAMNTGHDGSLTTLHANSPADCIMRLTTMVRYANDLPVDVIETQIGSALDYIVQVVRARDGRRYVSEIAAVELDVEARRCRTRQVYVREGAGCAGRWPQAQATCAAFNPREGGPRWPDSLCLAS